MAQKLNKKPVTGMKDILPAEMQVRDYVIGVITDTYREFGFSHMETPCMESIGNLCSKQGGENEKLIFKILKRGEKLNLADAKAENDLVDGVWPDIISYTHIGENRSPQLSWQPVDGANVYVIYMVDSNTNGFLHWKSNNVTETVLPQGWASAVDYTGPHIGHGYTHTFDIYVMALKMPEDRLMGAVNAVNKELGSFIEEIDTDADGNKGNILAYGRISGSFTDARFRGERTVDENKPYYM